MRGLLRIPIGLVFCISVIQCTQDQELTEELAEISAEKTSEVIEEEAQPEGCTGTKILYAVEKKWERRSKNGTLLLTISNGRLTMERKLEGLTTCLVDLTEEFDWQAHGYRSRFPISWVRLFDRGVQQDELTRWPLYVAKCDQQRGHYQETRRTKVNLYPLSNSSITRHAAATAYKCQ